MSPYASTLPGGIASTRSSTRWANAGTSTSRDRGVLWLLERRERSTLSSVRGKARVDLVDPADDPAADVHRVSEAGALHDGERFGRPHPRLAVQDDALVLRHPLERRSVEELTLRDQHRARDRHDLELRGLADVDEKDVLPVVDPLLEFARHDRRALGREHCLVGDDAAERLVVDQLGDRRVLAAD